MSAGRGRRCREEVVQEGRVDAIRGVSIGKGGKTRLLSAACKFLDFPYQGWGEGREVFGPVREFGLFDGGEVGPASGTHGRVVVWVARGFE